MIKLFGHNFNFYAIFWHFKHLIVAALLALAVVSIVGQFRSDAAQNRQLKTELEAKQTESRELQQRVDQLESLMKLNSEVLEERPNVR